MLLRIGSVLQLVPPGLGVFDRKHSNCQRLQTQVAAERGRPDGNSPANNRSRSRKGPSIENKKRRRGRPAWTRKPDDTPFRFVSANIVP